MRWFALSVIARHEKTVANTLTHKGIVTFLPLYKRRHSHGRGERVFDLPLFPGYLFIRCDPRFSLPVLTTPGVIRLTGAGRTPLPVEDQEIESLQRATRAGAAMQPHPFWHSGQRGRITSGALAGLEGVVKSFRAPVRLVLSVELLQRSVLLEIDADCVAVPDGVSAPVSRSEDR